MVEPPATITKKENTHRKQPQYIANLKNRSSQQHPRAQIKNSTVSLQLQTTLQRNLKIKKRAAPIRRPKDRMA